MFASFRNPGNRGKILVTTGVHLSDERMMRYTAAQDAVMSFRHLNTVALDASDDPTPSVSVLISKLIATNCNGGTR